VIKRFCAIAVKEYLVELIVETPERIRISKYGLVKLGRHNCILKQMFHQKSELSLIETGFWGYYFHVTGVNCYRESDLRLSKKLLSNWPAKPIKIIVDRKKSS
jgi:hypothetical protein